MGGRLPVDVCLRASLQSKADHWSRRAGTTGIALLPAPGQLQRGVAQTQANYEMVATSLRPDASSKPMTSF